MRRRFFLVIAVLGPAACGGGAEGPPPPFARAAFVVTATTTVTPAAGQELVWQDFPKTHVFTLFVDGNPARVVVGAEGKANVVALDTPDGRAFQATEPLALTVPFSDSCDGRASIAYDELRFAITPGTLTGSARGRATFITGDVGAEAPVLEALAGIPDVVAPALAVPKGAVDPLAPLTFSASEPLPETVTAALRPASGGAAIPLEPIFVSGSDALAAAGAPRVVSGFRKPDVTLAHAETYLLDMSELVDLAGNRGAPVGSALSFVTEPPPPLTPEDGFESVTTATFGGAGVLRGDPLTPISGTTSLILNTGFGGGFGFLPYQLGPSLSLRLAVSPGDTVLRFAARLIATQDLPEVAFYGDLRVGSEGHTVTTQADVSARGLTKVTLPKDGDIYVGPVATVELPLPAGSAGEVTFEIVGQRAGCGIPPPSTALVIDDLRVE